VSRLLVCLALLGTQVTGALGQIAYIKHNALYVLPCDKTGLPPKGAKPFKVCDLWADQESYVYQPVGWAAPGKIWLVHSVKSLYSDPKRSIFIVDARVRPKPAKLALDPCSVIVGIYCSIA